MVALSYSVSISVSYRKCSYVKQKEQIFGSCQGLVELYKLSCRFYELQLGSKFRTFIKVSPNKENWISSLVKSKYLNVIINKKN